MHSLITLLKVNKIKRHPLFSEDVFFIINYFVMRQTSFTDPESPSSMKNEPLL